VTTLITGVTTVAFFIKVTSVCMVAMVAMITLLALWLPLLSLLPRLPVSVGYCGYPKTVALFSPADIS
jgi:hypothetical protein